MIQSAKLEQLLVSMCQQACTSTHQSHRDTIRAARQRFANDATDHSAANVLAANFLVADQPDRTIELLRRSPNALQQNANSNRLVGYAHWMKQQFDLAEKHLRQSVELNPCQSDAWTRLGQLAHQNGHDSLAMQYYQRAIVIDDTDHEPGIALARLHSRRGQLCDAIHVLRVCLLKDRRSPEINIALARLLQRRATILKRQRKFIRHEKLLLESLRCYQTANAARPQSKTLVAQGLLQQKLDQFVEAKTSFQEAVRRNPDSATALTTLANANVDCGDLPKAISLFQQSLRIAPDRPSTHFRYSRAQKFSPSRQTKQYIQQIQSLLADNRERKKDQVLLHFALAKVLDDIQSYDEAWQHYDQANRLKAGHSDSKTTKPTAHQNRPDSSRRPTADQTIESFSADFFCSFAHVGNPSPMPIFIVGMPRSGTTMTEQILSSHPNVAGAGELRYIDQIRYELTAMAIKASQKTTNTTTNLAFAMHDLPEGEYRDAADRYLKWIRQYRTTQDHVTDKMPTNFNHLGLIATLFPNATIVHCCRNPMDVFVSSYCQNLNAPFCDLQQLVYYYRDYRVLMRHWQTVLPIKIHTVHYEAMVANPEVQAKELIRHCGLEWDHRCLEFHKNSRAVHTPSKWQVRQPMYQTSVEKWRRFEKHIQPVVQAAAAICDEFDN